MTPKGNIDTVILAIAETWRINAAEGWNRKLRQIQNTCMPAGCQARFCQTSTCEYTIGYVAYKSQDA